MTDPYQGPVLTLKLQGRINKNSVKINKIQIFDLIFSSSISSLSREALSSNEQNVSDNVNQFFERLELVLRQMLKESENELRTQAGISAQLIVTVLEGNISRFIRSKFKDSPSSYIENIWKILEINIFKN